jgi:mediator of RNA polymerase II transcription subunit 14
MVNGDRSPRRDGVISNGAKATSNGAISSIAGSSALTADQLAELPPEIAHLTSEYYHPLSKLLMRISQECFNNLNDTLMDMSKIPVDHLSNGALPNGLGGHANGIQNNSEGNKQKKLILMRFAQENRAKFIKLLVLTEWGKKSSLEISKVIDLFTWTRDQSAAMDSVDWQSSLIKEETFKLVEKNPDIRTALEILSTGKAEWIPDVCFLQMFVSKL